MTQSEQQSNNFIIPHAHNGQRANGQENMQYWQVVDQNQPAARPEYGIQPQNQPQEGDRNQPAARPEFDIQPQMEIQPEQIEGPDEFEEVSEQRKEIERPLEEEEEEEEQLQGLQEEEEEEEELQELQEADEDEEQKAQSNSISIESHSQIAEPSQKKNDAVVTSLSEAEINIPSQLTEIK